MEFKTTKEFDKTLFNRLQNRLKDFSESKRGLKLDPTYHTDFPREVNFQLTYSCNLRCKMCYQWSDDGYFHKYDKELIKKEISVDLFEKVLHETREGQSRIYIWGGEPLFHDDFSSISKALEKDPRYTILCSNGLLIDKNIEALERISSHLVILLSMDGPCEIHNSIRGKNTFERLIKNVTLLREEQRKGNFKGDISVNIVLHDELIAVLYEFIEFLEDLGVNSVYLNFPWYISKERANAMDEYFYKHLSWLGVEKAPGTASWHSFTFRMSEESKIILKEQVGRLNNRAWNIRLRFTQQLEMHDISTYIDDTYVTSRKCLALAHRIEIMADGKVGTCSLFFPELSIGDIYKNSLMDIWKSEQFNKLRGIIGGGLMPICSKCCLLYRNGI